MRGYGIMNHGIEIPNVRVALASKIPPEDCKRLNLNYIDPLTINKKDWKDQEDEGTINIQKASELLCKVKP